MAKAKTAKKSTKKSAKKSTKKSAKRGKKAGSGKRELIDTGRDKRFVKRAGDGTFKESDDVGRSLSADRRKHAKKATKSGYGDQGDRKR